METAIFMVVELGGALVVFVLAPAFASFVLMLFVCALADLVGPYHPRRRPMQWQAIGFMALFVALTGASMFEANVPVDVRSISGLLSWLLFLMPASLLGALLGERLARTVDYQSTMRRSP